ncbi:MAG TPA: hypothetical protein VMZ91_08465 [Candidatus Paceibacterota bacterium]|nr:hypothetical protein [Candidatus Paceibacterota bacterium]
MKPKTIELIIKTELSNEELLKILNVSENFKDLGIELLEIRVVGSANSLVKGIDYSK